MVENVSLPIFLAENRDQFNLQIGALIQTTPIYQVRIYDNSNALLFRVQNTSEAPKETNTLSDQLYLEESAVGRIEVDLVSVESYAHIYRALFSAIVSAMFATLAQRYLSARISDKSGITHTNSATNLTEASGNAAVDQTHNAADENIFNTALLEKPGVLIIVRSMPHSTDASAEDEPREKTLNTVLEIAALYDIEIINRRKHSIALLLDGLPNGQNCQRAMVFSWGITQLADEQSANGEKYTGIQTHVFDNQELDTEETLEDFWSNVESMITNMQDLGVFFSGALESKVDKTLFGLRPHTDHLVQVISASETIQKLWSNQRLHKIV